MRIGVVFPQNELGGDAGAVRAYGQRVEELGYTHLLAYDHVLGADPAVHTGWQGPVDIRSTFHEPLVMFGYLAAVTTTLELVTGVIVLPQRQAALVAKQAVEVDLLSNGRLRFGVGLGWLAVPAAAGSSERPKIFGHSLGGWVTATAARNYGKQINSILVIDSPLRERAPEEARLRDRKPRAAGYRSRNEILARFRVVPAQEIVLPYIAGHIARESVHKTSVGWTWKFDPAIFAGRLDPETPTEQELLEDMMAQMPCRLGYLRCEAGLVPTAMADQIRSIMQLRGPFIELAQAGHHPMLDQPLPLVATLRTLLEFWSII